MNKARKQADTDLIRLLSPITINHALASRVGLHAAIMLRHVADAARFHPNEGYDPTLEAEGRIWVQLSDERLKEEFAFWKGTEARDALNDLVKQGALHRAELGPNTAPWYAIDMEEEL